MPVNLMADVSEPYIQYIYIYIYIYKVKESRYRPGVAQRVPGNTPGTHF